MGNFLQFALNPWDITGSNRKLKNEKNARNEAMARSQSIQDTLDKQTKDLNSAMNNVDPVKTNDRVLTADPTKKNTIKSLNIPLNTGTSGTGLNV